MDLDFAFTASAPHRSGHGPGRPIAFTIAHWRAALHPSVLPAFVTAAATPAESALPIILPAMPVVQPVSQPVAVAASQGMDTNHREWNLARALFQGTTQSPSIELERAQGTYIPVAEWNAKPSRVETFLHSSQTKQTITGIAFLVMLLLWIF